jgi:hypothetical protein
MVRKTPLSDWLPRSTLPTLFEQIDDMGRNCALLQPTGSI